MATSPVRRAGSSKQVSGLGSAPDGVTNVLVERFGCAVTGARA
jgi:hypothetical protein